MAQRATPGRVRALLVVLALGAIVGLLLVVVGVAGGDPVPVLQGASLALVATLCIVVALVRTGRRR